MVERARMLSPMFGEFMGTMGLVLLGNGVIADVVLSRSKGESAGWFSISTGWAIPAMAGIFTALACGSSDAHINPAVTLGVAVASGNFLKLVPYIKNQKFGGFVG